MGGARTRTTVITNARVFDGEEILTAHSVAIRGGRITSVGRAPPADAEIVDAEGATLLPGLIDAHVHTDLEGLRDALRFGVTTELEMMGHWSAEERREAAARNDLADVRSAGMGITPPGGHPTEYLVSSDDERVRNFAYPFVSSPAEAAAFIEAQIADGADYIKIFLEDGTVVGRPGLPMLSDETLRAAVEESHRRGRMAIAHATTAATTARAVDAGADGLAHLFIDALITPEMVRRIASSGAFVTPCLTASASAIGESAAALADDPRVAARLSNRWLASLRRSMRTFPQGRMEDAKASAVALRRAGVDILAGSDVSEPLANLGGLAHGASLHAELQLLVEAGLTPIDAIRSATSVPARRFGLLDRGRIIVGARADLLLVDGDPTRDISRTLSTRAVWRSGESLGDFSGLAPTH